MAPFEVTFVDVGHGDATLIKTPDDVYILVDVYRCPGQGVDLFKLLDDVLPDGDDGRKRLDVLAITHAHDDHITGIGDLYDRYQVEKLWLPQHGEKLAIAGNYEDFKRVKDEHADEDTEWPQGSRSHWTTYADGDMTVRCFSPPGFIDPSEEIDEDEAKRLVHENCVVLKFSYGGCAVMLTGDSNKPCWERVVGYYAGRVDEVGTEVLECAVLHASHHGSRTFVKDNDAYLEALELIKPESVVISVGPDSKHEHPHDDMLEIYNDQAGADNVLQTCVGGTIRLEVDENGARLITTEGERYADDYGWDDEDRDDDGGGEDGGGARAKRSVPPAVPAPGYEQRKQQAPTRERYG